jgi:hypothetical protein
MFLGFFVAVVNHGLCAIARAIQNAGKTIGDNTNAQSLWSTIDMKNFLHHVAWIMWLYFVLRVELGGGLDCVRVEETSRPWD